MEGLVKIGPWGGSGGDPQDISVALHCLESVVIRAEGAVDAISFTYAGIDGTPRSAGPWGGSGGKKHKVKFGETEVVKEITGTYVGKHGPFGEPAQGTPFSVPVQNGSRVVGFFGRSGWLLDAIGVYVHP